MRWELVPIASLVLLMTTSSPAADWPTLRGNISRDGYTADRVEPPYRRNWVRFWPREILTTRVEAIVAAGKVFAGTYAGRLHAVDAGTGADLFTFQADGPILHSPAHASGSVYFATASPGKTVYRLRGEDGSVEFETRCGEGGFCSSPLVAEGRVLLGGRDGSFYALEATSGKVLWRFATGGPIRNTAASDPPRVFFASDDMHAYALEIAGGALLWKSKRMFGQSCRDYYPVVLGEAAVFRTNPMEQMGVHLGRTHGLIGKSAGIDGTSWKDVDAFLKEGKSRGSPEAFEREERAVLEYLESHPQARTFYVFDARTGEEKVRAPVLWSAGCQGVGIPPVSDGRGRAVVFTRTAYGNWSLGVAPLVGLKLLDFSGGLRPPEGPLGPLPAARAETLFHSRGNQPPWNTFWGTADETTNYSCGARILYACHQGTLCGFDLDTKDLFPIAGNRDTWGGEKSLSWARNEWHGPARGSLAISGDSLYWVTGSRLIAIRGKPAGDAAPVEEPQGRGAKAASGAGASPVKVSPGPPSPLETLPPEEDFLRFVKERPRTPRIDPESSTQLRSEIVKRVEEILDRPDLAPFLIEIGLGSHDFFFDTSAGTITALALAYPHLEPPLQARVKGRARKELEAHPLCGPESRYPLDGKERRELYTITAERFFKGWEAPQPLPEAYALDLYGERTGDWEAVERLWPRARKAWQEFEGKGWKLDIERGDRFANAYIAGLIGVARLAARFSDPGTSEAAARSAAARLRRLAEHWQRGVSGLPTAQEIENVSEVDRFIGKGNPLFFTVVPHRAKIAKFLDLTPEVGRALRETIPRTAKAYLDFVDADLPGWYLAFEERQVHFGENSIDFPDQAFSIYEAKRFIGGEGPEALSRFIDIPWCPADLFHLRKLVLCLEAGVPESPR